jgi:hypothetical protein
LGLQLDAAGLWADLPAFAAGDGERVLKKLENYGLIPGRGFTQGFCFGVLTGF